MTSCIDVVLMAFSWLISMQPGQTASEPWQPAALGASWVQVWHTGSCMPDRQHSEAYHSPTKEGSKPFRGRTVPGTN